MKKEYVVEVAIWFLLLICLSGAAVGLQHFLFIKQNTYSLVFQDIDGVIKGSPVRFAGVVVGHVRNIAVKNDSVSVQIIITKPGVKIPDGTVARVEFTGLAGSKSIEMSPPQGEETQSHGIIAKSPIRLMDFLDSLQVYSNVLLGLEKGLVKLSSQETLAILEKLKTPYDLTPINQHFEGTEKLQIQTNKIIQSLNKGNKVIEKLKSKFLPLKD